MLTPLSATEARFTSAAWSVSCSNAWGAGEKIFNQDVIQYTDSSTGTIVSYQNPKFMRSTGVEMRIFLPGISPAPLRFIWARKLNPYPFDAGRKIEFNFSIGTTF